MCRTGTNGISILSSDLLHAEVADDDILDLLESETEAVEDSAVVSTEDTGVAADIDLRRGLRNGAADDDDLGLIALDGRGEFSVRGDGGGGTASTAGSASVQAGEAESGLCKSAWSLAKWENLFKTYIISTLVEVGGGSRSCKGRP